MDSVIQNIEFKNPNQILNMGGPWIGEIYFLNEKIADNVIIDNVIYDDKSRRLFFVQFKEQSKWKKNNFFVVNHIDLSSKKITSYESKFDSIFISSISESGELIYYDAFHDKNEERKEKISLDSL